MKLDFIFRLMLCSPEDVSINSICLNVLKDIKQFHLLTLFEKIRLETPFKGDNVKAFIKTSKCDNLVLISLRKLRTLRHLPCFLFGFQ